MFIDTTGWAFTYPVPKVVGCRVVAYVHYPTVSTGAAQASAVTGHMQDAQTAHCWCVC